MEIKLFKYLVPLKGRSQRKTVSYFLFRVARPRLFAPNGKYAVGPHSSFAGHGLFDQYPDWVLPAQRLSGIESFTVRLQTT